MPKNLAIRGLGLHNTELELLKTPGWSFDEAKHGKRFYKADQAMAIVKDDKISEVSGRDLEVIDHFIISSKESFRISDLVKKLSEVFPQEDLNYFESFSNRFDFPNIDLRILEPERGPFFSLLSLPISG